MSVAPRQVRAPSQGRAPVRPATSSSPSPRRVPHRRANPAPRPVTPPRRARRRPLAFLVFASVLVGAMVLGLTSLNAVLAQGSFRIADLTKRVDKLQQDFERKQLEVAELTSPGRIAARGAALGMVLPEPKQVKVVHVSGPPSRDSGGGRHPVRPGNAG